MKKVLSLFLSLVMLLTITTGLDFSSYAATSGDYEYTVLSDDTVEITAYIGSATDLTIPSTIDGYTVTSIGEQAFYYYNRFMSVTIPGSITNIGNSAFYSSVLTSITILGSVTSIGDMAFYGCGYLTSVTMDGVISIGNGAFRGCDGLISITIPDSVTSIGDEAFSFCDGLTSVIIGNGVTNIGNSAFQYRRNLTRVTMGNSVTNIGDQAFDSCDSLASIDVDINNKKYSSFDGVLFNKDKTLLIRYPIGNGRTSYTIPDSVTRIGDDAFSRCKVLTSITIPDSVISIGSWAFYVCENLRSVTIPNSVISIGNGVFCSCSSLTSTIIGNSITHISDSAFKMCKSLANVTIGNSVVSIGEGAFIGCKSLESVIIPDSVTSIGYGAFQDCSSLSSVTIGNSLTSIGYQVFLGTEYYKASYWENGVLYIGNYLIDVSEKLTGAYKIKDGTRAIANSAFHLSEHLTSIAIPNSVISIGDGTFSYCSNLTSITIDNSIKNIGYSAFEGCIRLSDVYFYGTPDEWNTIEIDKGNDYLLNAKIHYLEKSVHTHIWNLRVIATEPTCTSTGAKTYTCTECCETKTETIPKTAHTYKTTTTKATTKKNGSIVTKCSVCGNVSKNIVIYYPKTITLSTTSYTYNGKVKKPSVTVKDSKGKKISSSNYTVSYSSGRKNVGQYTVTVKFKGKYSGTVKKTFIIKPKATTISKVTASKKAFTVKWNKQATQTTGYQIQYSASPKFKSAKTVTVFKYKTTSKKISKLKAKKKYYVRIRTYKNVKVNGKNTKIYSFWSKVKTVKTK